MSVHYKFKAGKDSHTITFDNLHISLSELKKLIMQQQKMGKSTDLDLQITNALTKEVYESDTTLIPKNTSVIVARVPVANVKKPWNRGNEQGKNDGSNSSSASHDVEKPRAKASGDNEDDMIQAMLSNSTKDYDPTKYAKGGRGGPMGPLPPNYTCHRCGKQGHYIKNCPTNNNDVKRSTGIPRSFMMPATADQKGAKLTASGEYVVPIIDHQAYKEVKKERPPFAPVDEEEKEKQEAEKKKKAEVETDESLQCLLCKSLLQDAVLTPCCLESYCDECIRNSLLESDGHECPGCHKLDVSPDSLIPNRLLRIEVAKFKKENMLAKATEPTSTEAAPAESGAVAEEVQKSEDGASETSSKEAPKEAGLIDLKDIDMDELYQKVAFDDTDEPQLYDDEENDKKASGKENEQLNEEGSSSTSSAPAPQLQPLPLPPEVFPPGLNRFSNQMPVRGMMPQQFMAGRPGGGPLGPMASMGRNNFNPRSFMPNEGGFFMDSYNMNMPNFGGGPPFGMPPGPFGPGGGGGDMYGPPPMAPFAMMNMNMGMGGGAQMGLMDNWGGFGGFPGNVPGGGGGGPYMNSYSDYEDKFERFNRQLASSSSRDSRRRGRSPRSRSPSYSSSGSGRSRRRHRARDHNRSSSRHRYSRSRSPAPYHKPSGRQRHRSRSKSPKRHDRSERSRHETRESRSREEASDRRRREKRSTSRTMVTASGHGGRDRDDEEEKKKQTHHNHHRRHERTEAVNEEQRSRSRDNKLSSINNTKMTKEEGKDNKKEVHTPTENNNKRKHKEEDEPGGRAQDNTPQGEGAKLNKHEEGDDGLPAPDETMTTKDGGGGGHDDGTLTGHTDAIDAHAGDDVGLVPFSHNDKEDNLPTTPTSTSDKKTIVTMQLDELDDQADKDKLHKQRDTKHSSPTPSSSKKKKSKKHHRRSSKDGKKDKSKHDKRTDKRDDKKDNNKLDGDHLEINKSKQLPVHASCSTINLDQVGVEHKQEDEKQLEEGGRKEDGEKKAKKTAAMVVATNDVEMLCITEDYSDLEHENNTINEQDNKKEEEEEEEEEEHKSKLAPPPTQRKVNLDKEKTIRISFQTNSVSKSKLNSKIASVFEHSSSETREQRKDKDKSSRARDRHDNRRRESSRRDSRRR